MKGDIKYYQLFGGEKVIFDKEEVDQMKKFDQPGMVLFNITLIIGMCRLYASVLMIRIKNCPGIYFPIINSH